MNKDQIVGMLKMEYLAMSENMYLAVRFPGVFFAAVFFPNNDIVTWFSSCMQNFSYFETFSLMVIKGYR